MALTDSFVLPAGTTLQPVLELSEEVRRAIGSADGDFALSRMNSRAHSKLLDAETAALIRQFIEPTTIAQAVARFSWGRKAAPEQVLEGALPLLQSLIAEQLLVDAESAAGAGVQPSLSPENSIEGWTIVRCVQTLEDSEVYQTRACDGRTGALKIGRAGEEAVSRKIAREAHILSRLDSVVTPRFFGAGEWQGRQYVLTEWLTGTDAHTACEEFRRRAGSESRRHLLRLTSAILEAYARLHEQGVIHGDIHPRNLLIDRHGAAKIIDFGLARLTDDDGSAADSTERGGVSFFFEPEFALAGLKGVRPPAAGLAGEQYSLAAMLYLLLTGSHYLDFSLEKSKMLRQIAETLMRPFAELGVDDWTDVERHLGRALSKDPAARFLSIRDFARAWQSIEAPESMTMAVRGEGTEDTRLASVRDHVLENCALGGPLMGGAPLPAPAASLNYGSAGVAYSLYRIACASDDAELLALADVWSARSLREMGNEDAFYNRDFGITPETVGRNSLYHGPAGVHVVQALVAQARGDVVLQSAATQAFIDSARQPCVFPDVTLGRAGLLLGCVFLLDALRDQDQPGFVQEREGRLRALGQQSKAGLWRTIDRYAPVSESRELSNLGIAHGWAGILYATLCWCAAANEPLPDSLSARLQQLADCAEPVGRGLQWKWVLGDSHPGASGSVMPGWCNGSAGYVFLWTEAHKALGEGRYLELAEGAAWNAWETQIPVGNLCCGTAGQAYALLNLYRHTGDPIWLRRARDAAGWAAAAVIDLRGRIGSESLDLRPESLYKGEMGVAVLAADLERPEQSHLPMFERESPAREA
jgi:eukaryotic-like serine/threonine-protein kinase